MQDQKNCDPLIDYYFEQLDKSNVIVGEVYTGLGVKESSEDHLTQTAIVLLDTLLNKN